MDREHWKYWFEGTGIVAIVASLVFVGLQLKQSRDFAGAEGSSQLFLDQIEWVNLVNANREVWIRGNKGEDLSELEMSAYRDLFRTRSSMAFFQYRKYPNLGTIGEIFIADFATYVHKNPGARREWEFEDSEYEKYRLKLLSDEFSGSIVEIDQGYDSQLREKVEELDRLYGRKELPNSMHQE